MLQHHARTHRLRAAALGVVVAALAVTACSGGEDGNGGSAAPTSTAAVAAERPSSPAKLTIEQPRQGQTVKQARPELVLNLDGAKVVNQTTTRVQGDEGHIHLYVDGKLVTMNYGLRQRLPQLPPGQHVVQVEFVAADHAPFDPRILTQSAFQVAG
jgi:methionine-rich copper-binding protein CopC